VTFKKDEEAAPKAAGPQERESAGEPPKEGAGNSANGAAGETKPEAPGEAAPEPSREASESSAARPTDVEPVIEVIREPEECPAEEKAPELEQVQKRTKRAGRKELFDLIKRKSDMLAAMDKELKKTQQELKVKEDRILRLAAEFENYKKRTRREWELLQTRANADLIREIIGGIDNFDRAFEHYGEEDAHLREGLRLIHNGLMDILRKAGLTEIDALHQKFDPSVHEAVGEIESADVEEDHVAQVVQKGYRLHDSVLRPARVLVSRKSEHTGTT
jgi:molecular chaperone GrpE